MSSSQRDGHASDEEDDGYRPGEKIDVKTLMEKDSEDESLRRYKEQLLGLAAQQNQFANPDDPRQIVFEFFRVDFQEHPSIEFRLDTPEAVSEIEQSKFRIKQGSEFRQVFGFRVQRDIVTGLQYGQKVYKHGIRVDSNKEMIGSYPAGPDIIVYEFPWDTAPSGWLARGSYKGTIKFKDDDKTEHLQLTYKFEITKEWE